MPVSPSSRTALTAFAVAALVALAACGSSSGGSSSASGGSSAASSAASGGTAGSAIAANQTTVSASTANACDLSGFLAAQQAHASRAEVTLCGTVTRVRALRRTRSGVHRVFFVDVGNGDVIEIDADVNLMGDFPIHTGETTTIRGEYYDDPDGHEGVHWTHHTDYGHHPPGYVILDGTRYQ